MSPRAVELSLELGVVVLALAHLPAHLDDGEEDDEVQQADQVQERPRDRGADDAGPVMERGGVVLHRAVERPYAEVQEHGEDEDDGRVTQ